MLRNGFLAHSARHAAFSRWLVARQHMMLTAQAQASSLPFVPPLMQRQAIQFLDTPIAEQAQDQGVTAEALASDGDLSADPYDTDLSAEDRYDANLADDFVIRDQPADLPVALREMPSLAFSPDAPLMQPSVEMPTSGRVTAAVTAPRGADAVSDAPPLVTRAFDRVEGGETARDPRPAERQAQPVATRGVPAESQAAQRRETPASRYAPMPDDDQRTDFSIEQSFATEPEADTAFLPDRTATQRAPRAGAETREPPAIATEPIATEPTRATRENPRQDSPDIPAPPAIRTPWQTARRFIRQRVDRGQQRASASPQRDMTASPSARNRPATPVDRVIMPQSAPGARTEASPTSVAPDSPFLPTPENMPVAESHSESLQRRAMPDVTDTRDTVEESVVTPHEEAAERRFEQAIPERHGERSAPTGPRPASRPPTIAQNDGSDALRAEAGSRPLPQIPPVPRSPLMPASENTSLPAGASGMTDTADPIVPNAPAIRSTSATASADAVTEMPEHRQDGEIIPAPRPASIATERAEASQLARPPADDQPATNQVLTGDVPPRAVQEVAVREVRDDQVLPPQTPIDAPSPQVNASADWPATPRFVPQSSIGARSPQVRQPSAAPDATDDAASNTAQRFDAQPETRSARAEAAPEPPRSAATPPSPFGDKPNPTVPTGEQPQSAAASSPPRTASDDVRRMADQHSLAAQSPPVQPTSSLPRPPARPRFVAPLPRAARSVAAWLRPRQAREQTPPLVGERIPAPLLATSRTDQPIGSMPSVERADAINQEPAGQVRAEAASIASDAESGYVAPILDTVAEGAQPYSASTKASEYVSPIFDTVADAPAAIPSIAPEPKPAASEDSLPATAIPRTTTDTRATTDQPERTPATPPAAARTENSVNAPLAGPAEEQAAITPEYALTPPDARTAAATPNAPEPRPLTPKQAATVAVPSAIDRLSALPQQIRDDVETASDAALRSAEKPAEPQQIHDDVETAPPPDTSPLQPAVSPSPADSFATITRAPDAFAPSDRLHVSQAESDRIGTADPLVPNISNASEDSTSDPATRPPMASPPVIASPLAVQENRTHAVPDEIARVQPGEARRPENDAAVSVRAETASSIAMPPDTPIPATTTPVAAIPVVIPSPRESRSGEPLETASSHMLTNDSSLASQPQAPIAATVVPPTTTAAESNRPTVIEPQENRTVEQNAPDIAAPSSGEPAAAFPAAVQAETVTLERPQGMRAPRAADPTAEQQTGQAPVVETRQSTPASPVVPSPYAANTLDGAAPPVEYTNETAAGDRIVSQPHVAAPQPLEAGLSGDERMQQSPLPVRPPMEASPPAQAVAARREFDTESAVPRQSTPYEQEITVEQRIRSEQERGDARAAPSDSAPLLRSSPITDAPVIGSQPITRQSERSEAIAAADMTLPDSPSVPGTERTNSPAPLGEQSPILPPSSEELPPQSLSVEPQEVSGLRIKAAEAQSEPREVSAATTRPITGKEDASAVAQAATADSAAMPIPQRDAMTAAADRTQPPPFRAVPSDQGPQRQPGLVDAVPVVQPASSPPGIAESPRAHEVVPSPTIVARPAASEQIPTAERTPQAGDEPLMQTSALAPREESAPTTIHALDVQEQRGSDFVLSDRAQLARPPAAQVGAASDEPVAGRDEPGTSMPISSPPQDMLPTMPTTPQTDGAVSGETEGQPSAPVNEVRQARRRPIIRKPPEDDTPPPLSAAEEAAAEAERARVREQLARVRRLYFPEQFAEPATPQPEAEAPPAPRPPSAAAPRPSDAAPQPEAASPPAPPAAAITAPPTVFAEDRLSPDQPSVAPPARQAVPARLPSEPGARPAAELAAIPTPITLPDATRRFLRPLVGFDPQSVPIYRDAATDRLTAGYNADALTDGSAVVVASTNLAMGRPETVGLLAHELTHVARHERPHFIPPIARSDARPTRDMMIAAEHGGTRPASLTEESLAERVEERVIRTARAAAAPPQATTETRLPVSTERARNAPPITAPAFGAEAAWGGLPAPWEAVPDWMREPPASPTPSSGEAPRETTPRGESAPVVQRAETERSLGGQQDDDWSSHGSPGAQGGNAEPDLDALARQVYAILKNRLSVERRRIG